MELKSSSASRWYHELDETIDWLPWKLFVGQVVVFVALLMMMCALKSALGDTIIGTRSVTAGDNSEITVHTQLRYATLIVLPVGTQIVEGYTGDRAFWQIKREGNFVSVKPSRTDAHTNLQLLTADGHVYSFLLSEVGKSGVQPDLKVFVNEKPKDPEPSATPAAACDTTSTTMLHQAQNLLNLETKAFEEKSKEAALARDVAFHRVDPNEFLGKLQYDYHYKHEAGKPPFSVTAIYHNDRFTYIVSSAEEKPAVYEIKDKKPNLVSYQFDKGVYTIDKVIDHGYLRVGKKKVEFQRKGA